MTEITLLGILHNAAAPANSGGGWLALTFQALTGFGALATAGTLFVVWKQLKSDHDRSRRKMAPDLMRYWSTNLNRRASITRKLAETLNAEESRHLFNEEPFTVERRYADLLKSSIPPESDYEVPDGDQPIKVPRKVAILIRWELIKLLNTLETVLAPWRHNIADREILSEELRYLVVPERGHDLLAAFRTAAGGAKNFPAIHEFVEELRAEAEPEQGKPQPA